MSTDRSSMQRVIIERSYERLVLCYSDGHREEILDTERIIWLLHESEALVSFPFSFFKKIFQEKNKKFLIPINDQSQVICHFDIILIFCIFTRGLKITGI